MVTTLRDGKPYVWVTWLTSHLADEKRCWWAPWFRAHYKAGQRVDPTFRLDAWKADHATMRTARAAALRAEGFTVTEECEVKLEGRAAVLAGKVDILAIRWVDGAVVEAQIWDCKTGRQRGSDWWQVLIYLFATPIAFPLLVGKVTGFVEYRGGVVAVKWDELTADRRRAITSAILKIGSIVPPSRAPSTSECALCNVEDADCQDRVPGQPEAVLTEVF